MSVADEIVLPTPATRPRTILVLGGGGMKGMAHIGVWRALQESGIRPDAILGTSIGSLVGGMIGSGLGWREMHKIAVELTKDDIVKVNRRAVIFGGVREDAVFMGDHFRRFIERTLPIQKFSESCIPFRVNAVSLVTGEEVWFGTGAREDVSMAEALYASSALPIYFPPARIGEDYLVDGGILDVLAIRTAQAWGAERIIAADVGSELVPPDPGYFDRGMVAIHERVLSLTLQVQRRARLESYDGPPMLYIRPKIGHLSGWDFERTQYFLEEGYHAAREALTREAAA
jgi:NTE family protein